MEKVIDTIRSIKTARMELQKAIRNDKLATSPQLTDLSFVEKFYNAFLEDKGDHITVNDRKVFIFVVIYLYAPRKLFGGKMPHGMRRAIANVAGITCASFISSTSAELLILYTTYDDFQQEVDRLLNKVYSIIQ